MGERRVRHARMHALTHPRYGRPGGLGGGAPASYSHGAHAGSAGYVLMRASPAALARSTRRGVRAPGDTRPGQAPARSLNMYDAALDEGTRRCACACTCPWGLTHLCAYVASVHSDAARASRATRTAVRAPALGDTRPGHWYRGRVGAQGAGWRRYIYLSTRQRPGAACAARRIFGTRSSHRRTCVSEGVRAHHRAACWRPRRTKRRARMAPRPPRERWHPVGSSVAPRGDARRRSIQRVFAPACVTVHQARARGGCLPAGMA